MTEIESVIRAAFGDAPWSSSEAMADPGVELLLPRRVEGAGQLTRWLMVHHRDYMGPYRLEYVAIGPMVWRLRSRYAHTPC